MQDSSFGCPSCRVRAHYHSRISKSSFLLPTFHSKNCREKLYVVRIMTLLLKKRVHFVVKKRRLILYWIVEKRSLFHARTADECFVGFNPTTERRSLKPIQNGKSAVEESRMRTHGNQKHVVGHRQFHVTSYVMEQH